jgi:predicted MFS family arabinose efflux permease
VNAEPESGALDRTSAFLSLAAAAFVSGANLRLFDALLPSVAEDFSVIPAAAAVAATAFTLAYGLFQIVHGPLGDRLGKLRVIAFATLTAALMSAGSALAPDLRTLSLLRFFTGVGAAAIIPLSIAWIGDNSSYERRQVVLGRFVGYMILGQVMGPAIGGILAQFFSWREVFYGLAVFFLAVSILIFIEDRKKPRIVILGNFSGAVANYGKILRDSWVRTILFTTFCEGAMMFGALAYIGVYLKTRFALSFLLIGALLACYGIGALVYSLLVPFLLSRLDQKGFVRLGGLILLFCFASLPWIPFWQAAAPLLIGAGFGFYMFHNTLQTNATEMAPRARGTAIAVFAFCLFVGQAAGISLFGQSIRLAGYAVTFAAIGILFLLLSRWFSAKIAGRDPKSFTAEG